MDSGEKAKKKTVKARKKWLINPLTRIKPSVRIYSRKKSKRIKEWDAEQGEK
ncbi:MAG: hypothetical protein U9Q24_04120 [Candidatus Ratteibacteria bacterium]|nr:hypothetical protein [Candidatus Ratteibacteria bacterium]